MLIERHWSNSVAYYLTTEPNLLRIVFFDTLTPQDLRSLASEMEQIERSLPVTPNRLIDASNVSARELRFPDVFALAERRKDQVFPNSIKSALVASKPASVGFARMFQILNDHPQIEIQIFATLAAAEAWLADDRQPPTASAP